MNRAVCRVAVAIALVVPLAGCENKPEAKVNDGDKTAKPAVSTSASASTAMAASSASAPVAGAPSASTSAGGALVLSCDDGIYQAPPPTPLAGIAQPTYGGPGPQGDGGGDSGSGDGIGLGMPGGFGHGAGNGSTVGIGMNKPSSFATAMSGRTKITAGKIDLENTGRALCASFMKLRPCFSSVNTAAATLDGNAILAIEVGTEGHVRSVAQTGTLSDPGLATCLAPLVSALVFPKPEGGSATIETTIDYARRPGVANVRMRESDVTITGRLPPEVVKRIIRVNFPRLRACYAQGVKKNHDLAGTVFFDFTIDATGAARSSKLAAGGTLTDPTVTSCMVGVIATLSYPEPEGGTVSVHYGIDFQSW